MSPPIQVEPRRGQRFIILPSLLGVGDIIATLLGQTRGYWQGDWSQAMDANPLVRIALEISPLLSIPAAVIWTTLIAIAMTSLEPLWRRRLYVLLCVAHLIFIWGWIVRADLGHGMFFSFFALLVATVMRRQLLLEDPAMR